MLAGESVEFGRARPLCGEWSRLLGVNPPAPGLLLGPSNHAGCEAARTSGLESSNFGRALRDGSGACRAGAPVEGRTIMPRRIRFVLAGVVAACLTLAPATTTAAPPGQAAKLRTAITVQNMRAHEQAFQNIATANGGTRASGTAGYDASVNYVVGQLRAAGYTPQIQTFDFPFFQELAHTRLRANGTDAALVCPDYRIRHHDLFGQRRRHRQPPRGERQSIPARADTELVERGLRGG